MVEEWKLEESEIQSNNRVFSVRVDKSISPRDGKLHNFYVIQAPDWVNVVAVTEDNKILLIKQYRHGVRQNTLEIPGGMVDYGEEPLQSAKRELLEETGYEAAGWKKIGKVHPNPAIMSNTCHTFVALGCKRIQEPDFDGTEYIETSIHNTADVKSLILDGSITHSLVIAAFNFYFLGGC